MVGMPRFELGISCSQSRRLKPSGPHPAKKCPGSESNWRHKDFQSYALPLSYRGNSASDAQFLRQLALLRGSDSNRRPSGYGPDELPTALPRDNEWAMEELNLRPQHYQCCALTNWANCPHLFSLTKKDWSSNYRTNLFLKKKQAP